MTLEEIQREAAALTEEEQMRLRVFLKHIARVDTEENREELSRLKASFEAGNYVTQEEFEKAHLELQQQGR